jgi:hypothetical protein
MYQFEGAGRVSEAGVQKFSPTSAVNINNKNHRVNTLDLFIIIDIQALPKRLNPPEKTRIDGPPSKLALCPSSSLRMGPKANLRNERV